MDRGKGRKGGERQSEKEGKGVEGRVRRKGKGHVDPRPHIFPAEGSSTPTTRAEPYPLSSPQYLAAARSAAQRST